MARPDGSIHTDDWKWDTLPTLGVGGGVGWTGGDMPIDQAARGVMNTLFPRGTAGQGNPRFWGGNAQAGIGGVTPFTPPPTPNYPSYMGSAAMPAPTSQTVPLTPVNPFGAGVAATYGTGAAPNRPTMPFTLPGATSYTGEPDRYYGGTPKFGAVAGPTGAGGAGGSGSGAPSPFGGMSAEEQKWASVAAKMGLDWNTTKVVYMNPARNGTPNVAAALGKQMDDKLWGDAFFRATGRAPNDVEWVNHYNANGNWNADPLAGHNDAIQSIFDAQKALQQQTADPYPSWYTTP